MHHSHPEPGLRYRCRDCGALDTIVSVDLVPRVMAVRPADDGPDLAPEMRDDVFWEAGATIGFACETESCRFWHGHYGIFRATTTKGKHVSWEVERAHAIDEVAEILGEGP